MLDSNSLRFSVAPMMDWTDSHCRAFHRIFSRRARLYSEMVTANAILHGDRQRLLSFDSSEHPLALQLGGNDPKALAASARIGADYGYDEINLNCGCPSDRVQGGGFGACLMREPALVAECVAAMKAAVQVPVTVKCRIGVDDQEPDAALDAMATSVKLAGADALIVHARKAWLKGLSPKQNRDVPPLDYELVYRLKARHRDWQITINGGIVEAAEWHDHCAKLDGVMIGREAYQNPEILLKVDTELFGEPAPVSSGFEALLAYEPYIARQLEAGVRLHAMTRHLIGLFPGRPGARAFRRHLATEGVRPDAGIETLREAARKVTEAEARLPETEQAGAPAHLDMAGINE